MTSVPQTAFSLLYNATSVSPYRREAHEDLLVSFERFAVVDGAVRDACVRMENASYELRAASIDPPAGQPAPAMAARYRAARHALDTATEELFDVLKQDFFWFLSSYSDVAAGKGRYLASGRLEKPEGARSLLELVYHCLYVPSFATILKNSSQVRQVEMSAATWHALLLAAQAVSAGSSLTESDAHTAAAALCDALAEEYKDTGWLDCW